MEKCCRILIVDDEFIVRQGIRHLVNWEEHGYRIVGEASNGKEGLELAGILKPHIVICDIVMPIMNGLDLIEVLHKKTPDMKVIVLSGYEKFEYVRHALVNQVADYILKPTLSPEGLLKILDRTVGQIPNLQLEKKSLSYTGRVLEQYLTEDSMELGQDWLKDSFPYDRYRLMGMSVSLRDTDGRDLSQVIYEKVERELEELKGVKAVKFLRKGEFLCIAFNYPPGDGERLIRHLQDIMEDLTLIHGKMIAVIGKERGQVAGLKEEFREPEFLYTEIFYHKGMHLYEMGKEGNPALRTCKFNYRAFSAFMSEGRYLEAVSLFEAYIHKAIACEVPEFKLKNQTKNLLYNITGSVDGKMEQLEEIRADYFIKIDNAAYVQDFQEILGELARTLKACLGGGDVSNKQLENILNYIKEHCKEELDLKGLSKEFRFSYTYLSEYFNSRMGEGFSEYLNRIRIARACRMLEEEEAAIADISSEVGYSNQSYFSRVFKKVTGKTPGAYRREHSAFNRPED